MVNYIYTIYGLTAGVVYLLVALSFLKLRRSHPEWERPYKLRIPWFFGIASIIFCVYVIYVTITTMDRNAWIVLIVYIVLGIPFWAYAKAMQKKDPENWKEVITNPDTEKLK